MKIVKPSTEFRWCTPNALEELEIAGRTCYKSEDKITPESSVEFVRMIVSRGHHAMIEHACAAFKFITDRGVTHELVRHRIASYAQESTRYCNYGKNKFGNEISVIQPPGLSVDQLAVWREACLYAEAAYLNLTDLKSPPQIARSILPTCTKTEIVTTCNFREWRHIIDLRYLNERAHPQIREIIKPVYEWFVDNYPVIVEDMTREKEEKTEYMIIDFENGDTIHGFDTEKSAMDHIDVMMDEDLVEEHGSISIVKNRQTPVKNFICVDGILRIERG